MRRRQRPLLQLLREWRWVIESEGGDNDNDEVLYILYIYTETLQKSTFYFGFKGSLNGDLYLDESILAPSGCISR